MLIYECISPRIITRELRRHNNLAIIIFVNFAAFVHRPYLDFKTANTIATSVVHSKLVYCHSLYYDLPQSQIKKKLQNSHACAVTCRMSKSSHITPVLKSLHWLKMNERIKYKLLSPTYKVLSQPTNLSISTTRFLFNLVTTHVLHLWSLLLANLPAPLKITLLFSVCCTLSMERTPH